MIKDETVIQIKKDLLLTEDSIPTIAYRYNVSKASINNINIGKSHKEDILYPIRQPTNHFFTDNEVAFIRDLSKQGYSAKQIHIIVTKGSYSTITNLLSFKTRADAVTYIPMPELEERRRVFDFIITPHQNLVNVYTDALTIEDAVYIKLLGRFMAPLLETVEIFLPLIESDMIGYDYRIESRYDLAAYLEWGGTAFNTIWWIKNIFNNKINRLGEEPISYDIFSIDRFLEIEPTINLGIIKEMIRFETKENFKKSS